MWAAVPDNDYRSGDLPDGGSTLRYYWQEALWRRECVAKAESSSRVSEQARLA
jgi:hypothetical protein